MNLTEAFWQLRTASESLRNSVYSDRTFVGEVELNEDTQAALTALSTSGDLNHLRLGGHNTTIEKLPAKGRASFQTAAPKAFFDSLSELVERHQFDPPEGYRAYQTAVTGGSDS